MFPLKDCRIRFERLRPSAGREEPSIELLLAEGVPPSEADVRPEGKDDIGIDDGVSLDDGRVRWECMGWEEGVGLGTCGGGEGDGGGGVGWCRFGSEPTEVEREDLDVDAFRLSELDLDALADGAGLDGGLTRPKNLRLILMAVEGRKILPTRSASW
jgi:hypothetical protein